MQQANIIICTHEYILNPKLQNFQSAISEHSVVVFDECFNIDEVAVESLSMNLNNKVLDEANYCIKRIEQVINQNQGQPRA